jgi:uncharacterized protein YdaU (DUF1376 family)
MMHYYQFNIGDYKSHTEHLSETEDLCYRRLLDWYYLHEKPLPLDQAEIGRFIRMRTHCECIANVLREYFEETKNGWIHHRADREIQKTGEKSKKAKDSAQARWSKKDPINANAMRTHSERNATHNTEHITQDTLHKTQKSKTITPPNVAIEVWDSFVAQRKLSKATITQTVINSIQRQADLAGWTLEQALAETVTRGWRSFKAEWVKDKPQAQALKSFRQMDEERSKERYNQMIGRSTSRVIDITPDNFLEITDAAPKSH